MLSNKQLDFILVEDARTNVLSGSVRSGKTWISLLKFALNVANSPKEYEFIMIGKSITTLKRNCLGLLQELVGNNFEYSSSKKEGKLFGRTVWLEGANDARAETKIKGMTLGGAYVDELTQIPQDFYNMLMTRLSLKGAKLYATTNPDNPKHYVKTEIIDNEKINVLNWHFTIDDNPFLDAEYVKELKNEQTGVFYDRLILGLWKVAEGLIYPNYENYIVPTQRREYSEYQISIDYGTMNATAFGLYGLCGNVWYKVREYHHSGRESNEQKTDEQYYNDLVKFAGELPIKRIIIDPSAASFITLIRHKRKFKIFKAKNNVLDGIRWTATAMEQGLLKINNCCWETIKEMELYSWDDGASVDAPIKEHDHHCDEQRYFIYTNKIAVPKRKFFKDK